MRFRSAIGAVLLTVISVAAQQPAATKKPLPPAKAKAAKPEPSLRETILDRAHMALAPLPPEERAPLLERLTAVASDYKSPHLQDWAEELFQSAAALSGNARRAAQSAAVRAMTQLDPARAASMLTQMDPDPPADKDHPVAPLRAWAAERLIEVIWSRFKDPGVPAIRQLAASLAQNGDYPYTGVGRVIRDLGPQHAEQQQALFADALGAYQQQSSASADSMFARFLSPLVGVIPNEQLKPAFHLVVRNLEEHPSDYSGETINSSQGSVSISYLDTQLFQFLPVLRRADPDFADEILRDRPQIAKAQQVAHAGTVRFSARGMRPRTESQEDQDLDRGLRLLHQSDDPKLLAEAVPDTETRAQIFAQAAQSEHDRAPAEAEHHLQEAFDLAGNLDNPRQRLRALTSVAWSADALNNQQIRRQAIEQAFPIAERLVRDEFDDQGHFKPGEASESLGRLVTLGMENEPDATLAQIDAVPIPELKARLLIDAANADLPQPRPIAQTAK